MGGTFSKTRRGQKCHEKNCPYVKHARSLFAAKKDQTNTSNRVCAFSYVEHRLDCCSNPGWPAALIRIQQPEALQGRLADWGSEKEEREVIECVGERQKGECTEDKAGEGEVLSCFVNTWLMTLIPLSIESSSGSSSSHALICM